MIANETYPEPRMRGISLANQFSEWVESPGALSSLDLLIDRANPNWVSVWNLYAIHDIRSTVILENDEITSSLDAVGRLIDHAHRRGMHVMYTLQIVTMTEPDRHAIVPTPEWFSAYTQFLSEQAVFAEQHGVEILSVGTELNSTGQYEGEWREIVAAVRSRFSGRLTYQANTNWTPEGDPGWNWDISWWDAVDYIGANFYVFESVHARSVDPTLDELRELYRPFVLKLADLSQEYGKSVIITEIGPISVDGFTHHEPHSLYPYLCESETPPDFQEQADFTDVVMQLISETDFIEGIFWSQWELTTEDWTRTGLCWPRSQAFVFKPMERVLSSWYGARE